MKSRIHNSDLLYPELSYSIVGAAMDSHNAIGPGWNEWDYHRSMIESLESRGHVVTSHDRKDLIHRGIAVDHFELDVLVDDLIILELKHLKEGFHPASFTQLINYLKCWDKRLGMLINYGQERLRYQRVPFSSPKVDVKYSGEWERLPREIRRPVLLAVENILAATGSGYGAEVFKKLLLAELKYLDVSASSACLRPGFSGRDFEKREVDAILAGKFLLLRVSANGSASDLSYLKTYLKRSDATFGVLVDLEKPTIELRGVI